MSRTSRKRYAERGQLRENSKSQSINRMADEPEVKAVKSRPFLKFTGASAPKVSIASAAEAAEHNGAQSQSDLTTFTRVVKAMKEEGEEGLAAPAVPKVKAVAVAEGEPAAVPKAPLSLAERLKLSREKKAAKKAELEAKVGSLPHVKDIEFTRFSEDLLPSAIEIIGNERETSYEDKTQSPLFPLQTRLGFQDQIMKVFGRFSKVPDASEPDYDACKKLGQGAQAKVEMYEYQKFVREYTRNASPYRGTLVYHGLGSGKTCSAIAAAEALFGTTQKKVLVMTPASLRDNFIREISFCGFQHFRFQNHWVAHPVDGPTVRLFAKQILGLPDSYLTKATQIWVPEFGKAPNFNDLDSEERQEITKQIGLQISSKIEFMSYNGISASKLKEIACTKDENGYNFFDNKIIIIDEFHNLTRMMQGIIEPYLSNLPGLKRKVPLEPVTPGPWNPILCAKATDPRRPYLTNYMRGYLFYRLLSTARNSKIIALSGTPLINFPEETAIVVNLLGGYVHTCSFSVTPASEANKKAIQALLQGHPFVDFEEVELAGTNLNVLFTLVPEGIKKVPAADGTLMAQHIPEGEVFPSIQDVGAEIVASLVGKGMKTVKAPEYKAEPLLPPVGQEFRDTFLNKDGKTLKNTVVLMKRIQGLISYYRGSKKELMPEVTKDEVVRVPLSPYSQAEYQRVRLSEIDQTKKTKKKGGDDSLVGVGGKTGQLWNQIYELSQAKQSNSYRMFSRQACNFTFPEGIVRPRPTNADDIQEEIGKEKDILNDQSPEAKEGEDSAVNIQAAAGAEDEEAAAEEDDAIGEGAKVAAIAEAKEEGKEEEAEDMENADKPVVIEELEAVAGEVQPAVAAAPPEVAGPKKTLAQMLAKKRAEDAEKCKRGQLPGEPYQTAIRRAKNCLENFASNKLRLFAPGKKIEDEIKAGTPVDTERLPKYSPKFAAVLKSVLESPGSNLVYSNFMDMEGIGIFIVCMKANDFEPILIESDEAGGFRFTAQTVKSFQRKGVNRYLSFTGKEDKAIRSMALKVFNAKYATSVSKGEEGEGEEAAAAAVGKFTELPPEMSQVLVDAGYTGNLKGELCRVFCITGAGAEGLSLRNVRRVHIMEPHWNHVRTDQVKGRAVRICSHVDLDWSADPALNQRTVEVFTYVSCFSDDSLKHPDGGSVFPRIDGPILNTDGLAAKDALEEGLAVPAGAKDFVFTTDEYLQRISENKRSLLETIQKVMKDSAVDCRINFYENDEEQECIRIPGNPSQYAFHPILSKDITNTAIRFGDRPIAAIGPSAAPAPAPAPAPKKEEGSAPGSEGSEEDAVEEGVVGTAAVPKPKPTLKALKITFEGKQYLAVPVKERGSGTVLHYDLFAPGDTARTRKLGTSVANAAGNPTRDITLSQ
jgi:hypothetical protein